MSELRQAALPLPQWGGRTNIEHCIHLISFQQIYLVEYHAFRNIDCAAWVIFAVVFQHTNVNVHVVCCLPVCSAPPAVLSSEKIAFKGLSLSELKAWHECLVWLREGSNNKWIRAYWHGGTLLRNCFTNTNVFGKVSS